MNNRLAFACIAAAFLLRSIGACAEPPLEPCLKATRDAAAKLDYKAAINAADVCVAQFRALADREQAALEAEKAPQPPEGERVSDFDKNRIFKRNILNTVAASLFFKGWAAEQLFRDTGKPELRDLARTSYMSTRRYTYARFWGERGSIFSPAESARQRLEEIKW